MCKDPYHYNDLEDPYGDPDYNPTEFETYEKPVKVHSKQHIKEFVVSPIPHYGYTCRRFEVLHP